MIPKTPQSNPNAAGGFENPPPQGKPKRSHHKRKVIPSGAPESEPTRRGVPSGAPETPVNTDRLKSPSLQKEGLPAQAFAIVPDRTRPADWQLPHHTENVIKNIVGSVDWPLLETATVLLSLQGDQGRRISADPALIIAAARHIARHYSEAGIPIPTALCVLI
jgi:hypothetical protein